MRKTTLRRNLATIGATLVSFGAGCGGVGAGDIGTAKTVGALASGIQVNISVGYVSSSATSPGAAINVYLTFPEEGQRLGAGCPIVSASATFGGTPLTPIWRGGAARCSFNDSADCGELCLGVSWQGDITPSLVASPVAVDIVIADTGGTTSATVTNPFSLADVLFEGLQVGQTIHMGDVFRFSLQPRPPLTSQDLTIADLNIASSNGIYALFAKSGTFGYPTVAAIGGTNPLAWTLTVNSIDRMVTTGDAELRIYYRKATSFSNCPSNVTCSGTSGMEWWRLGVVYAN